MGQDAVNSDWDIQPQSRQVEGMEKTRGEGGRIHVESAWIPATAIFSLLVSIMYLSSRILNLNNTLDPRSNSQWTLLVVELLATGMIPCNQDNGWWS